MTVVHTDRLEYVTEADVESAFAPFVLERFGPDAPEWLAAVRKIEAKYAKPPQRKRQWTTPEGLRTPDLVQSGYEEAWTRVSLEALLTESTPTYFEWRGAGMLARAMGRKRVHHLLLTRVVSAVGPRSVCEVGFGFGLNLLLLSMQFPDVQFSGVELSEAGVRAARRLIDDPSTPNLLAPFAVQPLVDREAPQRLDLRQGSAAALPLEDKSVDMAITVLALEQMEQIRAAALTELARVARSHVVMIEPFADWNAEGHRREYIRRHDYFAARVDELPRYGLTPVAATSDMPNKLAFRAGIVVAKVEEASA